MCLVPLHSDQVPGGIDLFRLDIDLRSGASVRSEALTAQEHAHAQRLRQADDRARFMQTRSATRQLIARRLGCRPSEVALRLGQYGKPQVGGDELQRLVEFNVSHAGRHALIAMAAACDFPDLGIDIELCRNDLELEVMLDLAFTDSECDEILGAVDPLASFYLKWVGKEAVLKAVGVGVAEHLRGVEILQRPPSRLRLNCAVREWSSMQAVALPAPPGYAAALAWRAAPCS